LAALRPLYFCGGWPTFAGAVDTGAGTLTVAIKGGTVTLTLFDGTDLKLNGQAVTPAQLASALTAARAAHEAIHIHAEYILHGGVNLALHVDAHGR